MRTVLIVDDDLDDIFFLTEAIHQVDESVECFSAFNGEQALLFLSNERNLRPDFIFLDLNMPRLGGKECLKQIRSLRGLSDVAVVIYSTSKKREDVTDAIESSDTYYLTKPTSQSDLVKEVSAIFLRNKKSSHSN